MFSKNAIIYQIVTDRFDNEKGTLVDLIDKPDYNDKFGAFLGGTFNGIKKRLPYIQDLGATHILISPVQKSEEYHGYHQSDSLAVNPNFGSDDELKKLTSDIHERGLRVMLDYAPTHISSSHPLFIEKVLKGDGKNRDWFVFKDNLLNSEYSAYFEELVYKLTSGNPKELENVNSADYLGYFGLSDCPLLNLENPEVREWSKGVLENLMERFEFDDIRLDSGFLQPRGFIKELEEIARGVSPDASLLTEYWDFQTTSGQCYGFCSGEFDAGATLSFNNMTKDPDFFSSILGRKYRARDLMDSYSFVVSIDGHDLPRFNNGKSLQKIAATFQFASLYNPLIYYGNEIGVKQFNDGRDRIGQSRDPMRWDLHDEDMFSFYKRLTDFRRNNSFDDARISDSQINDAGLLLSYRLNLGDRNYCVLLNLEEREKPVNVFHLFGDSTSLSNLDIVSGKKIKCDSSYLNLDGRSAYLFEEVLDDSQ